MSSSNVINEEICLCSPLDTYLVKMQYFALFFTSFEIYVKKQTFNYVKYKATFKQKNMTYAVSKEKQILKFVIQ